MTSRFNPFRRRFIPACAGNSHGLANTCSENTGSSPRVRGTRGPARQRRARRRFIPACAGNSQIAKPPCRCARGSSPRVRGTPMTSRFNPFRRRFIPACAGNSAPANRRSAPRTVHPRVCGELLRRLELGQALQRFIPACAGNSQILAMCLRMVAVHPRVCGELEGLHGVAVRGDGSSPRVRGTPANHHSRCGPHRFIPACAGNSATMPATVAASAGSSPRVRGTLQILAMCLRMVAVHPRVCGELSPMSRRASRHPGSSPRVRGTRARADPNHAGGGSSPRVRGTHRLRDRQGRRRRFIPACAGNSLARSGGSVGSPVHPRVCGELDLPVEAFPPYRGSSPRVRGTPAESRGVRPRQRFIPACAGNSRKTLLFQVENYGSSPRVRGTRRTARRARGRPPVHPRVCGELSPCGGRRCSIGGSSPRVRGTRR